MKFWKSSSKPSENNVEISETDQQTLHVCMMDKFIPPFIDFINGHFNTTNHEFRLFGDTVKYPIRSHDNIHIAGTGILRNVKDYFELTVAMHNADKILLHGLFDLRVVVILWAMPWLLSKCFWVVWGGDLYTYSLGKRDAVWNIKEFFRRPVIKRIGNLVTYIVGDVELARKWYGAKGKYHECIMYPSNLYKEYNVPQKANGPINILVGSSADPSNNHLEVFEKIAPYKTQDIKIFVPLSYGDQVHAKEVIRAGVTLFGDKFVPLTEFMPIENYLEFLGQIDIAVFNQKRQQAMGNIITLLGLGKKVYLRDDVTSCHELKKLGISIFSTDDFRIDFLDAESANKNKLIVSSAFSEEKLVSQLCNLLK